MSAAPTRPQWLVSASLALYRALLLLYPARFRRIYGAQMTQTFRDTLRAAAQRGGLAGMAHVWRVTLGDLLITALAEQFEEITVMEQEHSLPRAASLASLIGATLMLVYGAFGLLLVLYMLDENIFYGAWFFDTRSALYLPANWAPTLVMPAAWVCVIVAMWALCVSLPRRGGAAVWVAGAVALIGAVMGLLGSSSLLMGSWNSWYFGHDAPGAFSGQLIGNPLPYLAGLNLYGRMIVGLGLLALALIAWRGAASGRTIAILLILGAVALVPHLYIYLAGRSAFLALVPPGAHYSMPMPWTPFTLPFPAGWSFPVYLNVMDTGFALVWGICWLLLGWRWLREGRAVATQPAPALGLSA